MIDFAFQILIVTGIAIVALVVALLHRLKSKHPITYAELGEPRFYLRRSFWTVARFVFSGAHRRMNDHVLVVLSFCIAAALIAYAGLFAGLYTGVIRE